MKSRFTVLAVLAISAWTANEAKAQEVAVVEEAVTVTEVPTECKTNYYSTWRDNWFIQIGAGMTMPFVENSYPDGDPKRQITATYNLGLGRWFSPYMGFRIGLNYSAIHWEAGGFDKAKSANANVDFMWDMCNSIGGVNFKRPVSVVPFIGLGGTFNWDYKGPGMNDVGKYGVKRNQWLLPVSAGIQFRFRLCQYVDFFAEGRAAFYGDNYNNTVYGRPIDINFSAIGGFSFNIGGVGFKPYNPCDYVAYINQLNGQVNDLRGEVAATAAALAAAEAQLPCPEVQPTKVVEQAPAVATPILSCVRFKINSAVVSKEEMVNVFNIAEWLKANPDAKVIVRGYADRDTGTSEYNMELSKRRAEAVTSILVDDYGIDPSRLTVEAEGSDTQVYDENNWNRIVIFAQ